MSGLSFGQGFSLVGGSGGTGNVTSVGNGTGLTGGPITSSGNISLVVPVTSANGGTGVVNTGNATFPGGNFTVARIDAAQTFAGVQTFSSSPTLNAGATITNGGLTINGGNLLMPAANGIVWNVDAWINRRGAANLQLGQADAAAPIAQALSTQGSRGGTDSNISGGNLTIASGLGTGNATVSTLALASPIATSGGTGQQTRTTGLTIINGTAKLTNYIVSTLPSASVAGAGALAFITDATLTAITGLGLTPIGSGSNKVPVYSDGTQWLIL